MVWQVNPKPNGFKMGLRGGKSHHVKMHSVQFWLDGILGLKFPPRKNKTQHSVLFVWRF